MILLQARGDSLKRRAESLPKEIDQWLRRAEEGERFEKNFSQLEAIDIFMSQYMLKLDHAASELVGLARRKPPDTTAVLNQARRVETRMRQAQFVWDYFRTKLEQRFDPEAAKGLLVADLVSHDCYNFVMKGANRLGIEHKIGLRDYPLVYLLVGYSPVTWPRGWKVKGLDSRMLPVPVIGIPWDQMASPWEMLLLHHEVSHDTDIDLKDPSQELGSDLKRNLVEEGVPLKRARAWRRWSREVFADLMGILLAGPAFVACLVSFLAGPPDIVYHFMPVARHPVRYLRTLLGARFVQTIAQDGAMRRYADSLVAQWQEVYAQRPEELVDFEDDFDHVIGKVLYGKLNTLKDADGRTHSMSELIGFSEEEFADQLRVRDQIFSGTEIDSEIPIRHIVGAAYMAAEKQVNTEGMIDENFATRLSGQMREAVLAAAPKGQLPLRTKRSERYLKALADACFEDPTIGGDLND